MKKVIIFMSIIGLVTLAGCSSNEAVVMEGENAADMSNQQSAQMVKAEPKIEVKPVAAVKPLAEPKATEPKVTETPDTTSAATGSIANKISICRNGNQVRTISVVYKDGDGSTSCEVSYEKSTGVQSLWNAQNDLSYCETKAREFVKKQEGWGWNCSALE